MDILTNVILLLYLILLFWIMLIKVTDIKVKFASNHNMEENTTMEFGTLDQTKGNFYLINKLN